MEKKKKKKKKETVTKHGNKLLTLSVYCTASLPCRWFLLLVLTTVQE